MTATVDDLLATARARLRRLDPAASAAAAANGALLVDIRPAAQRAGEGEIPGALIVERTALEWRLDPASPHRLPEIRDHGQQMVIVCSEGYSSSLAAAVLHDLGLTSATDLIGGFRAWARAGLPIIPPAAETAPVTAPDTPPVTAPVTAPDAAADPRLGTPALG